ncbi:MAG: VOC family protein [Acidobacteria bacterium]|nr:VOC family protein [Acidobacteriota bacterium]
MKVLLALVFAFVFILTSVFALQPRTKPAPVLLDDIRYYVSDRRAAEEFFTNILAARVMPHPGTKPLEFITFLSLRPGEGTINISPLGPFAGVTPGSLNRWELEVIEPEIDLPPMYGVYWLGIRTSFLNQTLTRLEIEGVRVTQRMLSLPHDILARAAMVEGPDFNQIALVERKLSQRQAANDKSVWGDFGIDHLLLLVKSARENEVFFREVFGGRVNGRRPHMTTMKVADATIVLAEPEVLGLKRENVMPRDPKKLRFGINQIGFLYVDVRAVVEMAKAKGYRFLLDDTRMNYDGQPTPYTIAITNSPDGLPCQMIQEDGRTGARIKK